MKRVIQLIGVRPEKLHQYIDLHNHIPPEVVAAIHNANLRNYSIFLWNHQLIAYMEYVGDAYEEDLRRLSQSEVMRRWQSICDTMQVPYGQGDSSARWMDATEIFHLEPFPDSDLSESH